MNEKNNIQSKVDAVMANIKSQLLSRSSPFEVQQTMDDLLREAFLELNKEEHKWFIRRLSLELHPDKLQSKHLELYNYLGTINAINVPFQRLDQYNLPGFFEKITATPLTPDNLINIVTSIFNKISYIFSGYQRYPAPLSIFVRVILAPADLIAVAGTFITALVWIALSVFIYFLDTRKQMFMNFITNNNYDVEYKKYVQEVLPEVEEQFLKITKSIYLNTYSLENMEKYQQIFLMDLQEFKTFYMKDKLTNKINEFTKSNPNQTPPKKICEQLEKDVQTTYENNLLHMIQPPILKKILLIQKPFTNVITEPLPKSFIHTLASIFLIRPIKAVIGLSLILTSLIVYTLNRVIDLTLAASLILCVSFAILPELILTAPIYLKDAISYLVTRFSNDEQPSRPDQNADFKDSYERTGFFQETSCQSSEDVEHHDNIFRHSQDDISNNQRTHETNDLYSLT